MTANEPLAAGSQPDEGLIVVGRIGAPHGVRGWVKVHSFTEPRQQLTEYQPLWIRRGQSWQQLDLAEVRWQESGLLARVVDVEDRDGAALLRNCDIAIEDAQLPELEPGEYYWQELIGLEVWSRFEGQEYRLGKVVTLMETGANDVLVVEGDRDSLDRRQRLIPYEDQFLLAIDTAAGRIEVDWDPHF